MDPSAPEYQYPGQAQPVHHPQLPQVRASSVQKEVRKIYLGRSLYCVLLKNNTRQTYFLLKSFDIFKMDQLYRAINT